MQTNEPDWKRLLGDLITGPALSDPAFSLFHQYSLMNQVHAMDQMHSLGIPVQPVGTLKFWNKVGRKVIKGQKARIWMCVPRTVMRPDEHDPSKKVPVLTGFDWKRWWFTLDQTEGDEYEHDRGPDYEPYKSEWSFRKCSVSLEDFAMFNGNVLGYAKGYDGGGLRIAVNPLVGMGTVRRTLVIAHELAHCLLHINEETREIIDHDQLDRNVKEGEAEATAFLVTSAIKGDTEGKEMAYSRGYVKHWYDGGLTDKMAERVVWAADQILKAMEE